MPELTNSTALVETIRYDDALQMRNTLDEDHMQDLIDAFKSGEEIPPVELFEDEDGVRWIGDGNHRFKAAQFAGIKAIPARILPGGRPAAFRRALGANAEHNALRRTNSDKRKAVKMALNSHNAIFGTDKIKNVAVAEVCAVAESFVRKIRKELEEKDPHAKPKDPLGREPEQIFMDFYFGKRGGLIPRLRYSMDSPDYAGIDRQHWAAVVDELGQILRKAEERAGLMVGANRRHNK